MSYYSQGNTLNYDQAIMQLNTDLAGGNAPDILDCSSLRIDPAEYGRKGYLDDLYPYLDGDAELGREDLIASVFSAYEVDGALYQTMPSFTVLTVCGPKSVVEEMEGWTFADLRALSEELGGPWMVLGKLAYYDLTTGEQAVTPLAETAADCLSVLISQLLPEFVDYGKNAASFDTGDFQSLLELCMAMEGAPEELDTLPLFWTVNITSFMEMQYFEALFGEEAAFIGYPTPENGTSYFADSLEEFSINAASENKEGAWAFLRIFFTEEYGQRMYNYTFPSNLNAMEDYIEHSMTPIMVEGEDGELVEETSRGNIYNFEYHAATAEQVESVLALIDSATGYYYYDSEIYNIIREEAAYYFSGDKSVEEVCALVQNRVSLYLAEQG